MGTEDVISVKLYGGKGLFGGREKPLEASVITCRMSDQCTFYASGTCMAVRGFLSEKCKHGTETVKSGYTSRAKKYGEFKRKWEQHECYGVLKRPNDKLGVIGDEVVFPYSYVKIVEDEQGVRVEGVKGFSAKEVSYIQKENLTPELIKRICDFKPMALMGGEITTYQEVIVPLFVSHLKEELPKHYQEFITEYSEYDKEINYVGRKALLRTVMPSDVVYQASGNTKFNETWYWNGEYLTYKSGYISNVSIVKVSEVVDYKIKPSEDSVIVITENEQVNGDTIFVD